MVSCTQIYFAQECIENKYVMKLSLGHEFVLIPEQKAESGEEEVM